MAIELALSAPPGNQPGTRVLIERGLFARLPALLGEHIGAKEHIVIADAGVLRLWRGSLTLDPPCGVVELPDGEAAKTPSVLIDVCRTLVESGLPRDGYIVAIGGGATGDLAGLAASLHLRGVPIVQVPTSLVAMVDACLGGKCAINIPEGKNLIGTFWNPSLMLVDPNLLSTLPEVEFRAGLGEVAKYAIGFSMDLLELLEASGRGSLDVPVVVETCLRLKADVVQRDPFERHERALLNLGHTTAHALESWAAEHDERIPHGLAVAVGLRVALDLALQRVTIAEHEHTRANRLLDRLGLPAILSDLTARTPTRETLAGFLARDKKVIDGSLRFVLPNALGHSKLVTVDAEALADAILERQSHH